MSLLLLAVAWCGGISAAAWLGIPWPLLAVLGTGLAAGLWLAGQPSRAWLLLLLSIVAILGMLRYDDALPGAGTDGVTAFNDSGETTTVKGVIVDVSRRERSQLLRLRVEAYRAEEGGGWLPLDGTVLLTMRPFPRFAYGDEVVVSGKLETPAAFEGFDYRAYLERKGIGSVSLFPSVQRIDSGKGNRAIAAVQDLRGWLAGGIARSMPEPEAALAIGMLLGERGAIPTDLTDDFNRSGLSHLIAISGSNIMLISSFVVALLWPAIGRRPAIWLSIIVVVLYAVLVGGSPSVLRATLMGGVVLGAQALGRQEQSLRALILTIAVLTAVAPTLVNDVSFQLSVAATAGIVLGSRRMAEVLEAAPGGWLRGRFGRYLAEATSVTSTASIAVLPVMAASFGTVSVISLLANLLAGPIFSLILLAATVSSLAGVLDVELARMVGAVTYLPVAVLVALARFFGGLPGTISIGVVPAWLLTAGLIGGGYLAWRRLPAAEERQPSLKLTPAYRVAAISLLLAAAVWLPHIIERTENRLQVMLLDVGQGDAILIRTPDERVVLVDGGVSQGQLLNQLGAVLPVYERRIDLVVLTHPQDDHVGGLVELADRFDIGLVITSDYEGQTAAYDAWRENLAAHGVPVELAEVDTAAVLGEEIWLEVLGPVDTVRDETDPNERSVILRLVYGNVAFLFTGDAGFVAESALIGSGQDLRADVLKVGHHGSDGSTSAEFLEAVQPRLAVISVGDENTYGHPSPTTRLRLAGIPVLRTDVNGRITMETNGRVLQVRSERGEVEIVEVRQGTK